MHSASALKYGSAKLSDLLKRQVSNSENYDRAILSLATLFLGLSFAFLKDIVPVESNMPAAY
jgi:hypothetical protein